MYYDNSTNMHPENWIRGDCTPEKKNCAPRVHPRVHIFCRCTPCTPKSWLCTRNIFLVSAILSRLGLAHSKQFSHLIFKHFLNRGRICPRNVLQFCRVFQASIKVQRTFLNRRCNERIYIHYILSLWFHTHKFSSHHLLTRHYYTQRINAYKHITTAYILRLQKKRKEENNSPNSACCFWLVYKLK